MRKFLLIFLQISMLLAVLPARAAELDPGRVLSDDDLTDTNAPAGFSQAFLESHQSGIAKMLFRDELFSWSMMKPGDLIDLYGRSLGVNPRFLLALIQKEQSLVDDENPSPCQIMWAAGYGRPDGSRCDDAALQEKYGGFSKQILGAAQFVRYFYTMDETGQRRTFGFHPGVTTTIDGQTVTPGNIATAILYSYTPHLHGNANLSRIWTRWFSVGYPDGSVLSSENGDAWLIQGGLKRRFANKSALHTRVESGKIIPVSEPVLAGFEEGAPIKFAEYSLVRIPSGTIYLLVGDKKRPIESMQVFTAIGFNPEELDTVDPIDLEPYADGDPITLKSAYPTGALLQNKKTGGVYFVEGGKKSPIIDASIMKADFPKQKLIVVSEETLEKYETTEPLKFKDGDLIASPGSGSAIFVISNGQRRPIVSGEVFEQLGYSWKRVIWTTDAVLNLHPLGQVVTGVPAAAGPSQTALAQ